MDRIAMKFEFANGPIVGWPWHFKINEDGITKFEWHGFRSKELAEKSFMGVALLLPTFPLSWKWSFLAIFTKQSQGIENGYNPAFYFECFIIYQQSDVKNDF